MTNTDPSSAAPLPEFTEGQKLAGCYVLRRKIDSGEEVVWLALDEVLGKEVSLHFVPTAVHADPRAMDELRQEIKRHRQLIHPNILRVYDFIEESGWAAVSMDAYEGESLRALLRKRPAGVFEPSEMQQWLPQLCQTLADAHKIQVVHRALSPSNIFLSGDRVLVAHFGISRVINEALARTRATGDPEPGLAAMSPQQLDGERPSALDDVYSFGALMHEVLTGQPLFTTGELVPQIRKSVPPPLSARRAELKKGQEAIPPAWDKAVSACLEKDQELRPKGMTEVTTRLGAEKGVATAVAIPPLAASPSKATATAAAAATAQSGDAAGAVSEKPAENLKPVELLARKARLHQEALAQKAAQAAGGASAGAAGAASSTSEPSVAATSNSAHAGEKLPEQAAAAETGAEKPTENLKPIEILARKARLHQEALAAKAANSGSAAAPSPPPPVLAEASKKKADEPEAPFAEAAIPDHYPSMNPRGSGSRVGWVLAALVLIGVGVYGTMFYKPADSERAADEPLAATTERPENSELTAVANQTDVPPVPQIVASDTPGEADDGLKLPDDTALEERAAEPPLLAQVAPRKTKTNADRKNGGKTEPAVAAPPAAGAAAASPSAAEAAAASGTSPELMSDPEVATKTAAVAEARRQAEAAEKSHQEQLKKQQEAENAAAEAKKSLTERTQAAAPVLKATEGLVAERQKREDAMKAAEAAAEEAKRLAAERAQAAEEARKALAGLETEAKEKLATQQKLQEELTSIEQTMTTKQREAADAAKAAAAAAARREELAAAVKRSEQELASARNLAQENARRASEMEAARQARAKEQERIKTEMAEAKRLFEEQMKALDQARERMRALEEALGKSASDPAPPPAPTKAPPAPGTSSVPPPPETRPVAPVVKTDSPDATLAMKTEPPKVTVPPAETAAVEKTPGVAGPGFANSLGMRFAPVGNVLFSVWLTRVQDFEAFAKATGLKSNLWKDPGFRQGPDHPVVSVTWQEALAFCKWLTAREQKEGLIASNQSYRLPTDLEWSRAVGLPEESGKTPEDRDMGVTDVYPWGNAWPPPAGAGNYTGEETGSDVGIKGYDDGFAWTSPVGSFPPNQFGLHDMGGNVWQWCMDDWNKEKKTKVLRGASWYNGAIKLSLLSSCRVNAAPDSSTDNYGFRCVLATGEAGKSSRR